MSRYVIVGAGAVGATLAAALHESGQNHALVARGAHLDRLQTDGLTLVQHGEPRSVAVNAVAADEVELTAADIVVFATKTQDLDTATRDWAWRPAGDRHAAEVIPVVTLQNGLDADRIALRRFSRVVGGTILTPAQYLEPGVVRSGAADSYGVLTIGDVPSGADDRVHAIADDLRRARYIVEVSEDITRWKAAKLLHSVRNALDVLDGPAHERDALAAALVDEAERTLQAAGIAAAAQEERTEDLSSFRHDPAAGIAPGRQSTWQSFARGTSSEVDYLNGEIVLLGRLHGTPTPVNAAVQQILGDAEQRLQGPGARGTGEVLRLADTPFLDQVGVR